MGWVATSKDDMELCSKSMSDQRMWIQCIFFSFRGLADLNFWFWQQLLLLWAEAVNDFSWDISLTGHRTSGLPTGAGFGWCQVWLGHPIVRCFHISIGFDMIKMIWWSATTRIATGTLGFRVQNGLPKNWAALPRGGRTPLARVDSENANFVDQQNGGFPYWEFCWSTKFRLTFLLINKKSKTNVDQHFGQFGHLGLGWCISFLSTGHQIFDWIFLLVIWNPTAPWHSEA